MTVKKYQLKNTSLSSGQYKMNGEWKVLKGNESLIVGTPPTSKTKNIVVTPFTVEVSGKRK